MGVSNRSRSSLSYRTPNSGWNFVRGAFALLALIGISFLFGFFVLARLMPDTRSTSNGIPAQSQNSTVENAASSPATNNAVNTLPATPQRNETVPGPTLEAEEDETSVQQPTTPDAKTQDDPKMSDADLNKVTENSTPPFVSTENRNPNLPSVQSPSTPDATHTGRRDRERKKGQNEPETRTENIPSATNTSLYRVQAGVYSTKEAAESEAAKVRERGFDANVHATTAGGRTLYHIQNGIYRNRANAESMRQRLKEAGIETHLAELSSGTAAKP